MARRARVRQEARREGLAHSRMGPRNTAGETSRRSTNSSFRKRWPTPAPPTAAGGRHGPVFVGPTIIHYGSEEQKQRFLPRISTGEDIWCQGFSEPVAGSDLAGLETSALADGDEYVVNGMKHLVGQGQRAEWVRPCRAHRSRRAETQGRQSVGYGHAPAGRRRRAYADAAAARSAVADHHEGRAGPQGHARGRAGPRLLPDDDHDGLRAETASPTPSRQTASWTTSMPTPPRTECSATPSPATA